MFRYQTRVWAFAYIVAYVYAGLHSCRTLVKKDEDGLWCVTATGDRRAKRFAIIGR